jgi:hypothetical protein
LHISIALGLWLSLGAPAVPSLQQAQEAAARAAAGDPADDASRALRARRAHWAPVVRGQVGGKDDQRSRRGEIRLSPLREDDTGAARTWAVTVQWDLAQVIYAREESQLALAQAHLSRLRREAAERAAELWIERRRKALAVAAAPAGPGRSALLLELLQATAALDAITGGLFRELLAEEEAQCAAQGESR